MSNAPTVLMGLFPLIRAIVRSGTSAATTNVTADDSGTLFVDLSTSAHTYNLPTVALGKGKGWFFFSGQSSANTIITSASANLMMCNDDAAATTNTLTTVVGGWCLVICDGTYHYCFEGSGTWDAT